MTESLLASQAGPANALLYILSDGQTDTNLIRARMTDLGYRIHDLGRGIPPDPNEAPDVIICVTEHLTAEIESTLADLKQFFAPREILIIGVLGKQHIIAKPVFDTVLFQPVHPVQVTNRINALVRLRRMEKALALRQETLETDFSAIAPASKPLFGVPFRILFVGKASPDFMSVLNALQEKNVEVFAAFTSFTAFDYLHEKDFDAVVLNAVESLEPALSISETMRRNPRLFHVPTLVMGKENGTEIGEKAMRRGASDVFYRGASRYEICGRILELANFYRIHTRLKSDLAVIDTIAGLDVETGLYNRDFLFAHLARVSQDLDVTKDKLSLLIFRLRPKAMSEVSEKSVNQAITQVGSMLRTLVRAEDITGRMSRDVFAIAFPGQSQEAVNVVGQRIKDIIDCAAFESGMEDGAVMTLEVETLLSEKMAHETSDLFVTRTETELLGGVEPALAIA